MKNLQTILLGLVIALGVIYIAYNETRIAEAETRLESLDIETMDSNISKLFESRDFHQKAISTLEESHGRLVDASFKADEEIAKVVDRNTEGLAEAGQVFLNISDALLIIADEESFANHYRNTIKNIHDNFH